MFDDEQRIVNLLNFIADQEDHVTLINTDANAACNKIVSEACADLDVQIAQATAILTSLEEQRDERIRERCGAALNEINGVASLKIADAQDAISGAQKAVREAVVKYGKPVKGRRHSVTLREHWDTKGLNVLGTLHPEIMTMRSYTTVISPIRGK